MESIRLCRQKKISRRLLAVKESLLSDKPIDMTGILALERCEIRPFASECLGLIKELQEDGLSR